MKCNKCPNAATLHITEIVSEDHVEELHLCEVCAHKYLSEPQAKHAGKSSASSPLDDLESPGPVRECEMCGIKFVDFRNTGRLGCRTLRRLASWFSLEKITGRPDTAARCRAACRRTARPRRS
jgi:protein-arginine kinase activator protein McsA